MELFQRIKKALPIDDTMKYESRINHVDWEAVNSFPLQHTITENKNKNYCDGIHQFGNSKSLNFDNEIND